MTYGNVIYRPAQYDPDGRIHVDMGWSFFGKAGKLAGIIDLARISKVSTQRLARLSAGSAVSNMQINQAFKDGSLVKFARNHFEQFKAIEVQRLDASDFKPE